MAKKKLTAAVVGLGNIGLGYDLLHGKDYVQTHTKAYLRHRGFQLLFGVDLDAAKRSAFKRYSGKPAYVSLKEALKDFPSVDVLSLCVGPQHRATLWDAVAQIHPKVLILEKPLAKDISEGKRIVSWAAKNKISLCVNYFRRFETQSYLFKFLFKKKRWGRLVGVDIRYNGGFYNNASHYIDLMRLLFGTPRKAGHAEVRKNKTDVDVDFYLEYPSFRVLGRSVDVGCPVGEITFWCERAQICYRKFGQQIDILEMKPDPVFRKFNELALDRTIKTKTPYAMAHMADAVYEFCCGRQTLLSDGKNALETLELCGNILSKH
jgi:predicted dehydrogenase